MTSPEVEPDLNAGWEDDHCQHHQHDDRCGGYYDMCESGPDDDYCCHCDCCCTCLGCEYGPRDGMVMFPNGNPEIEAMAQPPAQEVARDA